MSWLCLLLWRKDRGPTWGNVVCLTRAEGKEHEMRVLAGVEEVETVYPEEVVRRVAEVWKEESEMRGVRWVEMYAARALLDPEDDKPDRRQIPDGR